ncbi:MAG: PilZ domain-containing protein [Myxococcota bacterium]|nr:PilZ domain-containing protein [Myxococcota bacterium]
MVRVLEERRKYPRIATDQVISFSHIDAAERLGLSRDVSAGGLRFEAIACEIALGDVIRLTFQVSGEALEASGTVVWATELDAFATEVGVEFHDLDPRAPRLLAELERGQPEPT